MNARRGRGGSGSSILAVPLMVVAGAAVIAVASRAGASRADAGLCPARPAGVSATGATIDGQPLSGAQIGNARLIYDVAAGMRLPGRAAVIGIATAMQESRLENIPYGTADSLGLFQQRPSYGWGTPAEIMRPGSAATAFYDRLLQVPGWRALPLTVAAQDVQRSAYPDAYAQWEPLATDMATAFSACDAGSRR
ncbi:MAG TPA: hypothetical protein VF060_14505 [Trebonia sp.]